VRTIRAGVEAIDGLEILGDPDSTLLAMRATSAEFDLFSVADEMRTRGWYTQPQFAHQSSPVNLHLTITASNRGNEREFLGDLAASVVAARSSGPVVVPAELAAYLASVDPDTLTLGEIKALAAGASISVTTDTGEPGPMAGINALLAEAPTALRERLLLGFLSSLYGR